MAHKGWYQYDPTGTGTLWIVPPKCGSNSFSEYFPYKTYEGKQSGHTWTKVYIVVRHPYARVVSGLNQLSKPLTTEQVLKNQGNIHLRQYYKWLNGRDATPISIDELAYRYGNYPHLNSGNSIPWYNTEIDWNEVYPLYEQDFKLCPDWSHTNAEL